MGPPQDRRRVLRRGDESAVSEETSPDGPWPDDRAIHRYELVVARAPAVEKGLRWIGVLVVNLAVQDNIVVPGGDRVLIKDRASGSTVATFKQAWGDNFDWATHLSEQLTSLPTDQFERQWLSAP